MHTLIVLNPGHFHAALTLRERNPLLSDDVYVYAEAGPDLEKFLAIVKTFNERPANPTRWKLHVYRGADYLERLLAERPGNVAMVAGKNDTKMAAIQRLHDAGLHVLGDKPWLIAPGQLAMVEAAARSAPLAMDIMTERHDVANRLQRALASRPEVFGEFRRDGAEPAIYMKSVHHLYKQVNGRPLVRPAWYFDTKIQGAGVTDVTTHLADLAQWIVGGEQAIDYARDVAGVAARQWPTVVPRETFALITGLADFPPALHGAVKDGALHYLCNAAIRYRLRGVPVEIEAPWGLIEPEGTGDLHNAVLRGTLADLVVEQGAETGFLPELNVCPLIGTGVYGESLRRALILLQSEFPGIACEADAGKYRIRIPAALRNSHEQRFALVLQEFLNYVDRGAWPANLASDLVSKYTLLAQASESSDLLA
jgi:predicted dehydrogenase